MAGIATNWVFVGMSYYELYKCSNVGVDCVDTNMVEVTDFCGPALPMYAEVVLRNPSLLADVEFPKAGLVQFREHPDFGGYVVASR